MDPDISHEEFALLSYDEQDVTKCYRAMLLCCLKWKIIQWKKTNKIPQSNNGIIMLLPKRAIYSDKKDQYLSKDKMKAGC